MNEIRLPSGFRWERLQRTHPRRRFRLGQQAVDDWLATKAFPHQEKRLSVTKVLLDDENLIAGYYTLATGQVDFGDLSGEVARHLPRRLLPVAILAWLGVDCARQRRGLGTLLLGQALRDCWEAGKTFAFVAVIVDCFDDDAREFYKRWGFQGLPGHASRLFVTAQQVNAMLNPS